MFDGLAGTGAAARVALARARSADARSSESEPFSLVVDLSAEPVGRRWARGAATLALLCAAALALAPGLSLLPAAEARAVVPPSGRFQLNPMLTTAGSPVPQAPEVTTGPEAAAPVVASTPAAIRVQGPVTEGLYWSLRNAGVSSDVAAAYLQALATRIDVGADVAPFDRFDLVFAKTEGQPLLYAALRRADAPDVELLKWSTGGRTDWFDTEASAAQSSAGLMSPVAGRITSRFGSRRHPILGFARFHSGIDFGAAWGSPIAAAADGVVVGAGWSGGYGRQVRVAHEGGVLTTYSHMSGIAAAPGATVRQGQVIGYVGSTGLSTGPHLHFEVRVNGRAVDPMQVQLQRRQSINGAERQAFNARLKQLTAIGSRKA
jgi:murein DD-endopeptidase MepM/ murein hydrolase activator NlpD